MAQIENFFASAKLFVFENRRALFWIALALLGVWILIKVQEIAFLLLASYGIALLIEPLVRALERLRVGRTLALLLIAITGILVLAILLILIIPAVVEQYSILVTQLPNYVETIVTILAKYTEPLGLGRAEDPQHAAQAIREWLGAIGVDQLRALRKTASQALLSGYSLTLMAVNVALIPFFVFYISSELAVIHRTIGHMFSAERSARYAAVAQQILGHVYAFFRGQITIACIMAVLYGVGLSIVGLPSGLAVGVISGLLGIVPYLGISVGLILSTLITVVTNGGLFSLLSVWAVFGVVQLTEGTVLTPRILGQKMGIHPFGVMLALIIGGQLFGLVGLVIAIPAAASLRVLFLQLLSEVEGG